MANQFRLLKFFLFVFLQVAASLAFIYFFQKAFILKPQVIAGHLLLVLTFHVLILVVGLLLLSKRIIGYRKVSKFVAPLLYSLFSITLYLTYSAAYFGKVYNSRIFTADIILGYLKYFHELISTFSINPLVAYTALLFVPVLITASYLLATNFIDEGLATLKVLIRKHNFNNPPKYIQLTMVVFLLIAGFVFGLLFSKQPTLLKNLIVVEEPFVSVFLHTDDPFQGQAVLDDNEDIEIRHTYPKDIDFDKKNIILIVVDALRSDHLSLFGYNRKTSPFLDSLYSTGDLKKIDLAYSVAGASFAGINGILRSKIWANMGYNNFSLQQLLKDQGYKINFLISGDHTHFYGLKSFYGSNSDFNHYIDGSETQRYIVNDDRIIFEGLESIPNFHNNPSFFHFHLNSVHYAGLKQDQHKKFLPSYANIKDVENYLNRYDNGIIQADYYLKQVFTNLETKGYLQNSIVVITADHGEALGERGSFGHVKNVYTDQLLVPILFYDTDSTIYKNTRWATTVDIAPTIVDRLGLPIPESWEGHSLLSGNTREYSYHQMGDHYAIIHNNTHQLYKYVYNHKTNEEELYELNSDLYETNNIISSTDVEYVASLRNRLSQFRINPFN